MIRAPLSLFDFLYRIYKIYRWSSWKLMCIVTLRFFVSKWLSCFDLYLFAYDRYIYIWSIWILHVTPFCHVTREQRCETFRRHIWFTLKERCETFRCHIWFSGVRLRGVMQAALEGQQQHCLTPRYGYQSLGV